MKINKNPKKTLGFDPEKCSKLYEELIKVFQKHKPTVGEILVALGNLGYSLGASIEGYKEKGPSIKELQEIYYSNPKRIGIALMVQGLTVATWYEGWEQLQLENIEDKEES